MSPLALTQMHARRPSRAGSPDLVLPPPSPFITSGPAYDSTRPEGGSGRPRYKRPRSRADFQQGTLSSRLLAISARPFKSRRALVFLASLFALWVLGTVCLANYHRLASTPVSPVFLPLIRQSGKLIHRISPAVGSRVNRWSDVQSAADPRRPLTPAEKAARLSHTFHPNGLLIVNPLGRHPIEVLIEDAQRRWNDKVAKQSRTLKEAVQGYKLRYRRNPPKGFDDWCVRFDGGKGERVTGANWQRAAL